MGRDCWLHGCVPAPPPLQSDDEYVYDEDDANDDDDCETKASQADGFGTWVWGGNWVRGCEP